MDVIRSAIMSTTQPLTTEAQARRAIERESGRLPDWAWELASNRGWVRDVLTEADGAYQREAIEWHAETLAAIVAAAPRAGGPPRRSRPPKRQAGLTLTDFTSDDDPELLWAQRRHAAAEARQDPELQRVARQLEGLGIDPGRVWMSDPKRSPLRRHPTLAKRIYSVAARLATRYGWNEREARDFVLFGGISLLGAEGPVGTAAGWRFERGAHRLADRIVLAIHPSATREQVQQLFAAALRGAPSIYRRRDVSPADAARAAFVAKVNDGRSWADALAAWNRSHRKLRRKASEHAWRTFSRDCRNAWRRVTGERLEWRGAPVSR